MPPFFRHDSSLEHDTGFGHPERADRIRAIEGELDSREWLGWERVEAPAATDEQLLRVHPSEYVQAVREHSERSQAFDLDTPTSPGSWDAALRAAGGACALAEALLTGGERTGFSCLRPPGHHAERATALGFCLFANVAIAARHALDALGAERVMVVDWDVHHGNGTNALFHDSREVLFISIHEWPFWPGTGALDDVGEGEGEGYSINIPVPSGTGEAAFLSLLEHLVMPVGRQYRPDLILISAGYDAHRNDPLGGLALDTKSYGGMATRMRALGDEVGARVGAVLEGGYDLQALADSVIETMAALERGLLPPEVARHPLAEETIEVAGRYWEL
ncbi:MAG: histone deacetylase [Thermoleophilaceae bacterium]